MSFTVRSMSANDALAHLSRRKHDGEVVRLNDEACELMNAGKYDEARSKLKQALDLNPEYPTGWVNMGASYMEQERWAEAIPHLERAITLHPEVEGAAPALEQCREKART